MKKIIKDTPGVGIALENCSAIEVINSRFWIIASKRGANAYKVYWSGGKYYEEKIPKQRDFLPLSELFRRDL